MVLCGTLAGLHERVRAHHQAYEHTFCSMQALHHKRCCVLGAGPVDAQQQVADERTFTVSGPAHPLGNFWLDPDIMLDVEDAIVHGGVLTVRVIPASCHCLTVVNCLCNLAVTCMSLGSKRNISRVHLTSNASLSLTHLGLFWTGRRALPFWQVLPCHCADRASGRQAGGGAMEQDWIYKADALDYRLGRPGLRHAHGKATSISFASLDRHPPSSQIPAASQAHTCHISLTFGRCS